MRNGPCASARRDERCTAGRGDGSLAPVRDNALGNTVHGPYLRAATDDPPPTGLSVAPVGWLRDQPVELVYDPARHQVLVALGRGTGAAEVRAAVTAFGMERRWPQLTGVEVWMCDRIAGTAASLAKHVAAADAAPGVDRSR